VLPPEREPGSPETAGSAVELWVRRQRWSGTAGAADFPRSSAPYSMLRPRPIVPASAGAPRQRQACPGGQLASAGCSGSVAAPRGPTAGPGQQPAARPGGRRCPATSRQVPRRGQAAGRRVVRGTVAPRPARTEHPPPWWKAVAPEHWPPSAARSHAANRPADIAVRHHPWAGCVARMGAAPSAAPRPFAPDQPVPAAGAAPRSSPRRSPRQAHPTRLTPARDRPLPPPPSRKTAESSSIS